MCAVPVHSGAGWEPHTTESPAREADEEAEEGERRGPEVQCPSAGAAGVPPPPPPEFFFEESRDALAALAAFFLSADNIMVIVG